MIKRIDHVGVITTDVERAAEFYIEELGFTETRRLETSHSGTIIFVGLNGTEIELFGGGRPREQFQGGGREVGYSHVTLLVDNVDAESARLRERGVEFYMEPTTTDSGLRLAFLRDPDGNPIELLQRPEIH